MNKQKKTPRHLKNWIEVDAEIHVETGRFLKDAAGWLVKNITLIPTQNPPFDVKKKSEDEVV